jgi:hypothetical protein
LIFSETGFIFQIDRRLIYQTENFPAFPERFSPASRHRILQISKTFNARHHHVARLNRANTGRRARGDNVSRLQRAET